MLKFIHAADFHLDSAFAALGVAESVMNLFIYVITGACMGASVLIAQFYGEQNLPRLRQLYPRESSRKYRADLVSPTARRVAAR